MWLLEDDRELNKLSNKRCYMVLHTVLRPPRMEEAKWL